MPHPTADISAFSMKDGFDKASEVENHGIYDFLRLRSYHISAVDDELPRHPDLLGDKDFFVEELVASAAGDSRKLRAVKLGNLYLELQRSGKENFKASIYYINASKRDTDGLELLATIEHFRYGAIQIEDVLPLDFESDDATMLGVTGLRFSSDNYIRFIQKFRDLLTKFIHNECTSDVLMGFLDSSATAAGVDPISFTVSRSLNPLLARLHAEPVAEVDLGFEDEHPTPQKYAEYVESHKDDLTPATILWDYALEKLGSAAATQMMSHDNFVALVSDLVDLPTETTPEDRALDMDNLRKAFAFNKYTPIKFENFQWMIKTFASEQYHFRFNGAVFAAFKAANYPIEGGLDKLPIEKVKHVCRSLLPLASEIFAQAVNNAIYGFIPGAWVGFLPRKEVEALLLDDGKGLEGTYLVRLSGSKACEVALSYLASTVTAGGAVSGGASSAKPVLKVKHEILQLSVSGNGYVLRGIEYPTIAEAISHNRQFLKIPCLRARLMQITDTPIATPYSKTEDLKLLTALRKSLDGDRNSINAPFRHRISKTIYNLLVVDPFDPRTNIFVPKDSDKKKYSRYFFDAFHGCLNYKQTISRLEGKPPGTYLLRASQSKRGSAVLAFVDAAGKIQQSIINPDPKSPGTAKVICGETTYDSLPLLILIHSIPPSGGTALFQHPLKPCPLKGVAARFKIEDSLSAIELPAALCIGWHTFKESREKPISVEAEEVRALGFAKAAVTEAEAAVTRALEEAEKATARLQEARATLVKAEAAVEARAAPEARAAGGSGSQLPSAYGLFQSADQRTQDLRREDSSRDDISGVPKK